MGSSPETWHVEQFTSHFITELTIFINLSDPRMFAYLHLHFLALAVSAFYFKRFFNVFYDNLQNNKRSPYKSVVVGCVLLTVQLSATVGVLPSIGLSCTWILWAYSVLLKSEPIVGRLLTNLVH